MFLAKEVKKRIHNDQAMNEKTIQVASGLLAYWDSGLQERDQPVVLFLHGNSNSKEMYASLFPYFVEQDYRCLAVDLLGHGQSGPAQSKEKYSYHDQAVAMSEFLQMLNLKDVHVFGASHGGHIGYELLSNDRLLSLTTIGAPPISKVKHEGQDTYDFPNWFKFAGGDQAQHEEPGYDIMTLMQKDKFTPDEAKFWIAGAGITEKVPEYTSQLKAALETHPDARPALFSACMAGIGCDHNQAIRHTEKKVCLLVGEHDHIDLEKVEAFANSAGEQVSFQAIDYGSHYAMFGESSLEFKNVLSEILTSLQSSSPRPH